MAFNAHHEKGAKTLTDADPAIWLLAKTYPMAF